MTKPSHLDHCHLPDSTPTMHRRSALRLLGHMGAWVPLAAAVPGLSSLALPARAATPTDQRLVVVMLRGALDGLAAVPAPGDPHWASLRPEPVAPEPLRPLDGPFALHPALQTLHQWYTRRELLVLHAVASPYRERSHFDAQQLLEAGSDKPFSLTTGWLGRALQTQGLGGVALESAMPLGLRGADRATTWAPARQGQEPVEDTLNRIQRLYATDPALARNWNLATEGERQRMAGATETPQVPSNNMAGTPTAPRQSNWVALLQQAAQFLSQPDGPRVAWLDTDGWDTHTQQTARLGRLLPQLDQALASLQTNLGSIWAHTTVLVMTEFGRTAALNGTGGTDHGTAGVAFLAGGSVAGGRVLTDWPGLATNQLLSGRDLRPTQDIRPLLAAVVQRQFGLSSSAIARDIVPGVIPSTQTLWKA